MFEVNKGHSFKDGPYFGSNEQLIDRLNGILKQGDVVFTMGAGDVYKLKSELIKIINHKSQITNKSQILNLKLKIERKQRFKSFLNTLKTNSVAEYFLDARTREDLIEGKKFALENKLPLFILAGGSNLAIVKRQD